MLEAPLKIKGQSRASNGARTADLYKAREERGHVRGAFED